MKTCSTCGIDRPLEDFNRRASAPDGRQPRCRSCCKAWYLANQREHIAKVGVRSREMRNDYRGRIVEYLLEHPCVDCGDDDVRVLEFDHRPDVLKVRGIAQLVNELVSWQSILDEIAKCDVRCANCHRLKTGERGQHWRHRWYLRQQTEFDPADRLARIFRTAS